MKTKSSKFKTTPHQKKPIAVNVNYTVPFIASPTTDKPPLLGYIEVLYKCHFDSSVLL